MLIVEKLVNETKYGVHWVSHHTYRGAGVVPWLRSHGTMRSCVYVGKLTRRPGTLRLGGMYADRVTPKPARDGAASRRIAYRRECLRALSLPYAAECLEWREKAWFAFRDRNAQYTWTVTSPR